MGKILEFTNQDKIPMHIHRQLMFLNLGDLGKMFRYFSCRKDPIYNTNVYAIIEKDIVLSWAITFTDNTYSKDIRQAHFYTRKSYRLRGYFRYLYSFVKNKEPNITVYNDARLIVCHKLQENK